MSKKKALIVYCSPAGTTRHVAKVIQKSLEKQGIEWFMLDLGEGGDNSLILSQMREAQKGFLFIGSPVYGSHAVPPVMDFIAKLPQSDAGACAVPFVTWGGATSGIALYEMGKALAEKGFQLMGGAKILALHSMMRQCDEPLGLNHPDAEDDKIIEDLVNHVLKKQNNASSALPVSTLAYQPEAAHVEMEKTNFAMLKAHMPEKKVDQDQCNLCKICSDVCPANAITFAPYPQFGPDCICCFNCLTECPEKAISADLAGIDSRIRNRAKNLNEQPLSQIFF